jgi:hypothetical protein
MPFLMIMSREQRVGLFRYSTNQAAQVSGVKGNLNVGATKTGYLE